MNVAVDSSIFKTAWDFQQRMIRDVLSILSRADHAYIQSPMGTGKTYTMLSLGETSFRDTVKVVLVGRKSLVRQHEEEIDILNKKGLISDRSKWVVMTYQTANNAVKFGNSHRMFSILDNTSIIFFDECHLGGLVVVV